MNRARARPWEVVGWAAVAALALWLRGSAAGADPWPGVEQSLAPILDAFWYAEGGWGPAEGSHPEPNPEYDLPVWTGVVYLWGWAVGVSLVSAQWLGAALGLATIAATGWVARRRFGPEVALAAGLVLAAAYPWAGLSRTLLIYGPLGLWCWAGAAVWWSARRWSGWRRGAVELCAWGWILGTAAATRPPVLAWCGGLAAATWVRTRHKRAVGVALALALFGGLWAVGPGRTALEARVDGPTRGRLERNLADGLSWTRVTREVLRLGAPTDTGGSGSGLVWLAPLALTVAAWGAWRTGRAASALTPAQAEVLATCAGVVVAYALGAAVMRHRPLRYVALLGPPLAVFAGCVVWRLPRAGSPGAGERLLGAGVGAWIGAHAGEAALGVLQAAPLLGCSAMGAVIGGMWLRPAPGRVRAAAWAVVLASALHASLLGAAAIRTATFDTAEASATLTEVVGPDARLAGPYASVLATGTGLERIRAGWINTEPDRLEATLRRLRRRKRTHVLVDQAQALNARLEERFATAGAPLQRVAVLRVVDRVPVVVFRLPWAEELAYGLSAFERRRVRDEEGGAVEVETSTRSLALRLDTLLSEGRGERALEVLQRSLRADPALGETPAALERALREGRERIRLR